MRAESERYYHVIQSMRFSKRDNLICLSWDGISQRKENEEQLYIWHLQTSREFQVNVKECLVSKSFDYMDRNGIRYDDNAQWVQLDDKIIQFVKVFYHLNRNRLFSFQWKTQ